MKKTLSFMVMALALLLTQCRKPEVKFPTPSSAEGVTVSMTVTAGPGSKTDITTAGAITWRENDKLYVGFDGKYVGCLEIKSGVGTPTGWFSGTLTLDENVTGEQTFHFFYLGSAERTLTVGDETVDVDFSSQEIYADANNKLLNASKHHVGYGSAKGTVAGSEVTGINVTLVSKVALARFSFTKNSTAYDGALTLGGTNIYNEMTVNFGGTFTGKTKGAISLTGIHSERYVMLVPPADVAAETLNFDGGAGTKILENGIEANKFYGKNGAIPVTINAYVDFGLSVKWATCNLGASSPEEYGDYYAWGATETWYSAGGQTSSPTWKPGYSDGYSWTSYPFTNGIWSEDNKKVFTKYIPKGKPDYWAGDGNPDDKLVLESSDDAATVAWGSDWRMPTSAEWKSLYDNNTFEWLAEGATSTKVTSYTAVAAGYLVVKGGKKGVELDPTVYMFLPAAGRRYNKSYSNVGDYGRYWSSSVREAYPNGALLLNWFSGGSSLNPVNADHRNYGMSVRPVQAPR